MLEIRACLKKKWIMRLIGFSLTDKVYWYSTNQRLDESVYEQLGRGHVCVDDS